MIVRGPKPVDIRGVRFGRLTAVALHDRVGKHPRWLCVCDCGAERMVFKSALTRGITRSCGCWQKEAAARTTAAAKTTHGGRHTPEYSVFSGIKRRCNNARDASFRRYGALGVRCLYEGFAEFMADVGPRPSPRHSIDREDPHGHYEPGNCRWVLPPVQARNKKQAKIVTLNGVARPLADWCDDLGTAYKTAWQRLARGWPVARALGC